MENKKKNVTKTGLFQGIEEHIRPLSIFFFFSLMNEEKAIEKTIETLYHLKKVGVDKDIRVELVKTASRVILEFDLNPSYITKNVNDHWILPKGIELGPWKEYHKKIKKEELISLLWTYVIKYEEEIILRALNLSSGTHRFRLSNAIKKLGSMTFLLN